tara:strand:+ start:63 stop:575 length:513 start_codon:yes stop_codon:yes gene_type:complete
MRNVTNPNNFRKNIVERLTKITGNPVISKNLEIGIYNFTIQQSKERSIVRKWENSAFSQIYMDRLRSIYRNLTSNVNLREALQKRKFKAHALAFMTHQEMCPDRWDELIKAKKIKEENIYAPKLDANTDNFTCRRCKSKRCSYYQLQTRSADEPMTTFVTCIDCGNRWKC